MPRPAPLIAWRHALLEDDRLTRAEKDVALVLSVFWDGDGRKAYPSQPRIARSLQMSERTVRRALVGIRTHGIVEAVEYPGRTTVYHAVIPYPTPGSHVRGSASTPLSPMSGGPDTRDGGPRTPGTDEVVREEVIEGALEQHPSLEREGLRPSLDWKLCWFEDCTRKRVPNGKFCEEHRLRRVA
jgi:hypothetical protein